MHATRLAEIGDSTGITIPHDVLAEAHFDRGDDVTLSVRDGRIEIVKADATYNRAVEVSDH